MTPNGLVVPLVAPPPEDGYQAIPRMSIHHDDASVTFNDVPLTREEMGHMIFLGGARQRNMFNWDDSLGPRGLNCESKDYEVGLPTALFPWEDSNFDQTRYEPASGDQPHLPCDSCIFSDWVKDSSAPRGSRAPRCVEQIVGLFLVPIQDMSARTAGEYRLGQMTFQKSSLKPVNEFFKQERLAKRPPYVHTLAMRLHQNLGKGFSYSVPSLTIDREVDSDVYPLLSRILQEGRTFLSKPTPPPAPKVATNFFGTPSSPEETGAKYTGTFF